MKKDNDSDTPDKPGLDSDALSDNRPVNKRQLLKHDMTF